MAFGGLQPASRGLRDAPGFLADDSAADALGLSPGTPLVEVGRTLDFPSAPAAIHTVLTCNTSQLVFSQDLGDLTYA